MEKRIMPVTNKEARVLKLSPEELREINRNASFPARLRTLRKQEGLSQQKLASALKVTTTTIVKFEHGETVPDAQVLHRMAVFFNVSYDYLLCATDLKTTDMDTKNICHLTGLTEKSVKLLFMIRATSDGTEPICSMHQIKYPDYMRDGDSARHLLKTLNSLIEELGDEGAAGSILENISEYIFGENILRRPDGTKIDSILVDLGGGKRKRISSKALARDRLEAVISGLEKMYLGETSCTMPSDDTVLNCSG